MTDEKILKNAQYRKGLSIAYFNAVNSSVAILQAVGVGNIIPKNKGKKLDSNKLIKEFISGYVEHFLNQHKEYYANVIAQVGSNYDSKKTIELLQATKTKDELRLVWTALSEDERHDGEIRKVVKELKAKYK